ncbi:MAG TPA: hypothetical protein VJL10_08920 [Anaerolineales bacterium]|nr:hypothetical protein [Anaerolineales bacterium]
MRHYRVPSRFERWLQDTRDYVRALCEALVMNPLFFVALLLDCLALVVLWFFGLQ